ncbi:glycosyltransferase family 52, partial [Vibrio paracholerae]
LICAEAIPFHVATKFENLIILNELNSGSKKIRDYVVFLCFFLRFKREVERTKKTFSFFGADHLFYSPILKISKRYNLIEDGLINYVFEKKNIPTIYKVILGKQFGLSEWCSKVYLSGMMESPKSISKKVIIHTPIVTKEVLDVFDLKSLDIMEGNGLLLLTQPLSEDGVIDEDSKINIYSALIEQYNLSHLNLFIKPHPREITAYIDFFPNATVLERDIPFELVSDFFSYDTTVITLFSSSIYNTNFKRRIVAGTKGISAIERKFGVIEESIIV